MSSDRCEKLLLDLLADDLGVEEERAARAEIAACEEHAATLQRVELGQRISAMMPIVEPPARVSAAILAAARQQHASAAVAPAAATEAPSGLARLLAGLRRLATGPQLAMSTVMLLVVATGLWYLPQRMETPAADGDTVMAPHLAEGTQGARESAPLVEEAAEPPRRDEPAPAPRVAAAPERARRAPEASASEQARVATRSRVATTGGTGAGASSTDAFASSELRGEATPMVAAAPRRASAPELAESSPAGASAPAVASAPAPAALSDEAPAESEAAPTSPAALHQTARAHRAAGRCAMAKPVYEQLLAQYPSYAQRVPAMVELADCLRRTGHQAEAERWLVRAGVTAPDSSPAPRPPDSAASRTALDEPVDD